jgi:Acyltransferase family
MKDTKFTFSRDMTAISKGLAIFLMVYHHLFGFPDRIKAVNYIPIMMLPEMPLDQLIGNFGKLCVAIFLFLSGFGLYKSYQSKGKFTFRQAVSRALNFYKIYLIIFLIFIPVGLYYFDDTFRYTWNTKQFFYNLIPLIHTYNGEWWFVPLYIELVILFPFIIRIIEKNAVYVSYLSFIGMFFSAFFLHLDDYFPSHELVQIAIDHISLILSWQIMFITGIFFARYSLFARIDAFFSKYHIDNKIVYLLLIAFCIYIRQYAFKFVIEIRGPEIDGIYNYADFILVPLTLFSFVKLVQNIKFLEKIFVTLGNHSTIIWLTHTFFIYYFFQRITFAPHYSILIVMWVFIITIIISIVIQSLIHIVQKPFLKKVTK